MKKMISLPTFIFRKTDGSGRPKPRLRLPNSVEEIRCMLLAAVTVFARHNLRPAHDTVLVQLTADTVLDPTDPSREWGGMAWEQDGCMRIQVKADEDQTLTVLIHEYLHLLGFRYEKTVSTMVHRFKPEIVAIASVLLGGYYRGAAWLAHARPGMAYAPRCPEEDAYNHAQWERTESDIPWIRKHRKGR